MNKVHDKSGLLLKFWKNAYVDYCKSGLSKAEYCRSRLSDFIKGSPYSSLFTVTPSYNTFLKRLKSIASIRGNTLTVCEQAMSETTQPVCNTDPNQAEPEAAKPVSYAATDPADPEAHEPASNAVQKLDECSYGQVKSDSHKPTLKDSDTGCQLVGQYLDRKPEPVTGSFFSLNKTPAEVSEPFSFLEKWRADPIFTTTTTTGTSVSILTLNERAQHPHARIHGLACAPLVSFKGCCARPVIPLTPGEVITDRQPFSGMSYFPDHVNCMTGMTFPIRGYELKSSSFPVKASSSNPACRQAPPGHYGCCTDGSTVNMKTVTGGTGRVSSVDLYHFQVEPGAHSGHQDSGLHHVKHATAMVRVLTASQLPPEVLAMMKGVGCPADTGMYVSAGV